MTRILITGATGNVGRALLERCTAENTAVVAAARDIDRAATLIPASSKVRRLDFLALDTYGPALRGIDRVFLVRPPAISNIKKHLAPFLGACAEHGVERIVFLSLLGAENLPYVPHYKIEREIERLGIEYTYLRASFFMQNLSTTHRREIAERDEIAVPAGRGATSFIDARDIAAVAYRALTEAGHDNTAYNLTGAVALGRFRSTHPSVSP